MAGTTRSTGRLLIVVLMACAFATAQFSIAFENDHHHSSQHCCALCHAGLPFLQPAVSSAVPPVLSMVWMASFVNQDPTHQVLLAQASSRAPPA